VSTTVLALIVSRVRRPAETARAFRHVSVLLVFGVAYLALVVVTRTVLDAGTPLDNRILLPLIPLCYLVLVAVVVNVLRPPAVGRIVAAALCLVAAAGVVGGTITMVRRGVVNAQAAALDASPTMAAIRRLPEGTVIATGVGDLIYTDTGRGSIRVPVRIESLTLRANPDFAEQARQLATILADHHGVLVEIPAADSDFVFKGASLADFRRVASLHLVTELPDGGQIYRVTSVR